MTTLTTAHKAVIHEGLDRIEAEIAGLGKQVARLEAGYDTRPHPEWCTIFTDDGGCSDHDSRSQGFIPATADGFAEQAGVATFPAVDVRGFWYGDRGPRLNGPMVSLELNWPVPADPYGLSIGQISRQVELTPEAAAKVANGLRHGEPLTVDSCDNVAGRPDVAVTVEPGVGATSVRFDFDESLTMAFRPDEAAGLADVLDEAVKLVTRPFQWLVPAEVYGGQAVAA